MPHLQDCCKDLVLTYKTIYEEKYAGGAASVLGADIWTRNTTVTQTAEGRFSVVFDTPHPDDDYHISYEGIENANRDNPKITTILGTKTTTGFDVMITVDDNGTAADIYEDNPWSFGVTAPCQVIADIAITPCEESLNSSSPSGNTVYGGAGTVGVPFNSIDVSQFFTGNSCCGNLTYSVFSTSGGTGVLTGNVFVFTPTGTNWEYSINAECEGGESNRNIIIGTAN